MIMNKDVKTQIINRAYIKKNRVVDIHQKYY